MICKVQSAKTAAATARTGTSQFTTAGVHAWGTHARAGSCWWWS
jgi:hypothetical protein